MADIPRARRPEFWPSDIAFHPPLTINPRHFAAITETLLFYGYEGTYGDGSGRLPAIERDYGARARNLLSEMSVLRTAGMLETDT